MKTRDEQAQRYSARWEEETEEFNYGWSEPIYQCNAQGIEYAFLAGWDAALKSQWRDASEMLPTDSIGKEYLIHVEYNDGSGFNHCSASFINDHWNILDDEILEDVDSGKCEVTHWMPIPDLP